MKILAFDTSTEACSAALLLDDEIISRSEIAPRQHTELILPMIDDVLNESGISLPQLDAIAFCRGPGAFTGVRLTIGIAKGLSYATGIPLIPVSSLASLAQSVNDKGFMILAAIDARMGEIYQGFFNQGEIVSSIEDEKVNTPYNVILPGNNMCFGVGSGWKSYSEILKQKIGDKLVGFEHNIFLTPEI